MTTESTNPFLIIFKQTLMDDLNKQTRARWNALANANVMHSIPFLDYTVEDAKSYAHRHESLKELKGKNVLCLASGGGQDSAAFGLLEANVTVFDISDVMLDRDKEAATHHGYSVTTIQGDMRDLSIFENNSFDIVWQSISLNYSPVIAPVFDGVQRILRSDGIYRVAIQNPFGYALSSKWNGEGYLLKGRCIDGEEVTYYHPNWPIEQGDGSTINLPTPKLFRHNLSTVQNELAKRGFSLMYLDEWIREGENPKPGSWVHFTQCMPLFLDMFWKLGK